MDELTFEDFKAEYQRVPVEEYPNRVCETMPDPVVSVHVGTYQHANFIRDCIEGVLMQETDFPFEIVIGEDESDDGTREICKEYADRHPEKIRLLLHRRENNIAIHGRPTPKFQQTYSRFLCRGKYIAICQGDDYWTDPLKLQKQVDFLEANPEYVLSHHDASIIDADGKQLSASKLPEENKQDFSRDGLMKGASLLTLSLCFRNLLNQYPTGYFEVINSDSVLQSLLGKYGKAHYQGDLTPAAYRLHNKSMWSSKSHLFKWNAKINTYTVLENINDKEKIINHYTQKKVSASMGASYKSIKRNNLIDSIYFLFFALKTSLYRKKRLDIGLILNYIRFLVGHMKKLISRNDS